MMISLPRTVLSFALFCPAVLWYPAWAMDFYPLLDSNKDIVNEGKFPSAVSMSTSIASPPPQPQCWVDAFKMFQPNNQDDIQGSTKVCESIGPHQKKAFAFELARCHLEDVGRDIIDFGDDEGIRNPQDCTIAANSDFPHDFEGEYYHDGSDLPYFPNLSKCLKYMTDAGLVAYTQFFSQVMQLCNRLTEHMAIDFQQHAATQLAKMSEHATAQFHNLLHRQEEADKEREKLMKEHQETYFSTMQVHQKKLLDDQTARFGHIQAWTSNTMKNWQHREERHEAWLINQTRLIEDKTSALVKHHEEIKSWSERVSSMASLIHPILILETFVTRALQGFTLFTFSLHFLAAIYVIWFMTRPQRCRSLRGTLFTLAIFEKIAELCVYFSMGDSATLDAEQTALISTMRSAGMGLQILTFFSGLVISCCCCRRRGRGYSFDDDDYDSDEYYDAEHKLHLDESRNRNAGQFPQDGIPPPGHRRSMSEPRLHLNGYNKAATTYPHIHSNFTSRDVEPFAQGTPTAFSHYSRPMMTAATANCRTTFGSEISRGQPNPSTSTTTMLTENSVTSVASTTTNSHASTPLPEVAVPGTTGRRPETPAFGLSASGTSPAPETTTNNPNKRSADDIDTSSDDDDFGDDDDSVLDGSEYSSPAKKRRMELPIPEEASLKETPQVNEGAKKKEAAAASGDTPMPQEEEETDSEDLSDSDHEEAVEKM